MCLGYDLGGRDGVGEIVVFLGEGLGLGLEIVYRRFFFFFFGI